MRFEASTAVDLPVGEHASAGIAAFQNENYWYFAGVRERNSHVEVFLEKKGGKDVATLASQRVKSASSIRLKVSADVRTYSFYYCAGEEGWKALKMNDDGLILSTGVAGGFVGVVLGPYARTE
jgi:alpha-N-arabinofuranosidase